MLVLLCDCETKEKFAGIFSILVVFCMDHTRSFYNLRRRSSAAPPGMSSSPESGGVRVHPELSPVVETSSTSPTETGTGSRGTDQPDDLGTTLLDSQDRQKTNNRLTPPHQYYKKQSICYRYGCSGLITKPRRAAAGRVS